VIRKPGLFISTKVIFSSALVCLLTGLQKKLLTFTKFGVEVAHGPQKKPLVFVGNLDHVTLGLGRVRVTVRAPPYSTWEDMRYPAFFY